MATLNQTKKDQFDQSKAESNERKNERASASIGDESRLIADGDQCNQRYQQKTSATPKDFEAMESGTDSMKPMAPSSANPPSYTVHVNYINN